MSHQISKQVVYKSWSSRFFYVQVILNDYVTSTCIHTCQFKHYTLLIPSTHTHTQAHNKQFFILRVKHTNNNSHTQNLATNSHSHTLNQATSTHSRTYIQA